MHVGGRGHKHAQVATATLQLFIGFGWKHSGAWGHFQYQGILFLQVEWSRQAGPMASFLARGYCPNFS